MTHVITCIFSVQTGTIEHNLQFYVKSLPAMLNTECSAKPLKRKCVLIYGPCKLYRPRCTRRHLFTYFRLQAFRGGFFLHRERERERERETYDSTRSLIPRKHGPLLVVHVMSEGLVHIFPKSVHIGTG